MDLRGCPVSGEPLIFQLSQQQHVIQSFTRHLLKALYREESFEA